MRCLIPCLNLFYMHFLIIRQEIALKTIFSFKTEHERKQNPHSKFAHKRINQDDQNLIVGLLSARIFILKSITVWKFNRVQITENPEKYGISNLRTFLGIWCILKFEQIRVIHEKDNHIQRAQPDEEKTTIEIQLKLVRFINKPAKQIFLFLFMNGSRFTDVKELVKILNINNINKKLNSFAFFKQSINCFVVKNYIYFCL